MENIEQKPIITDAEAAAAPSVQEQKSESAEPTKQEAKNGNLTDDEKAMLQSKLQILQFKQAFMGFSSIEEAVKTLMSIIIIKKKLKQNSATEITTIVQLTIQGGKEYIKFGLEALYILKELTTDEEVKDKSSILSGIGSCEIWLQNYDIAEKVLDEAIKHENEYNTDQTGLHISGLYRMRTKIFEIRGQHELYVKENKLSVEILSNVKPELKSDFHDKYIAQIIPMYVEVEMEILKSYDHEETEKQLRRANDLWKKREGNIPKDFCHFRNSYLLLSLLSKSNDPSTYKEILDEVNANVIILKPLIRQSHQYMNTYLKSIILLSVLNFGKNQKNEKENDDNEKKDDNEEKDVNQNSEDDEEKNDSNDDEQIQNKEEQIIQKEERKIIKVKRNENKV